MTRSWIVGYDFSTQSVHALAYAAAQLASLGGGRMLVVHVHQVIGLRFGIDGYPASPDFDELETTFVEQAKRTLAEHVALAKSHYPSIVFDARVELGASAEVLTTIAEREGAEQIVVGSHGRRGLDRFFLGSVAERVLRLARIPVLVVKERHPDPA